MWFGSGKIEKTQIKKEACKLLPQPSSSEPSVQSLRPLQRCSLGMHIRFRQVQSDSKQSCAGEQFSSSEPLGHWICPSHRADWLTQPKESRQGKWFSGHFDESGGKQESKTREFLQGQCSFKSAVRGSPSLLLSIFKSPNVQVLPILQYKNTQVSNNLYNQFHQTHPCSLLLHHTSTH